ncbi:FAD-binding protein [Alloscardovia venturai]|uniref:UDP-N-acetylenolpyruvoylglucosamine reductase n=1 Tax=Alloscardovia venturai TaxID=1769421 RepID=A0ABW2Y456_9BIFI
MANIPDVQNQPSFADLTTIGVGGRIARFVEPRTREEFIETVRQADEEKTLLSVIGGGSNILVSDDDFDGMVVRDARHSITVVDDESNDENSLLKSITIRVDAGVHWDDFVSYCVHNGFAGVEALSGIPGTVGASVVQNIGAYGQEVASSVSYVELWDREKNELCTFDVDTLEFGYRTSILKQSMYQSGAHSATTKYFPSPRYIVLAVVFKLTKSHTNTVQMGQLAKALTVGVGQTFNIDDIRRAVLMIRMRKGMVEDPHRYENTWMKGTIQDIQRTFVELSGDDANTSDSKVAANFGTIKVDRNRWSCGSFFMNPIISTEVAQTLPDGAPQFDATLPGGREGIKTSAAWLIDHAGFKAGFKVSDDATAGLSTRHTLALTNRGGAHCNDILELARVIRAGVRDTYGITLVPEPVFIGVEI